MKQLHALRDILLVGAVFTICVCLSAGPFGCAEWRALTTPAPDATPAQTAQQNRMALVIEARRAYADAEDLATALHRAGTISDKTFNAAVDAIRPAGVILDAVDADIATANPRFATDLLDAWAKIDASVAIHSPAKPAPSSQAKLPLPIPATQPVKGAVPAAIFIGLQLIEYLAGIARRHAAGLPPTASEQATLDAMAGLMANAKSDDAASDAAADAERAAEPDAKL